MTRVQTEADPHQHGAEIARVADAAIRSPLHYRLVRGRAQRPSVKPPELVHRPPFQPESEHHPYNPELRQTRIGDAPWARPREHRRHNAHTDANGPGCAD